MAYAVPIVDLRPLRGIASDCCEFFLRRAEEMKDERTPTPLYHYYQAARGSTAATDSHTGQEVCRLESGRRAIMKKQAVKLCGHQNVSDGGVLCSTKYK